MKKRIVIEGCPLRTVMDRFGDKWSILVLQTLGEEEAPIRFNDLDRGIEDISQKMLASTLRVLEGCGLISREAFLEIPPRVEYQLTDMGKSLLPLIKNLVEWSTDHLEAINSACMAKSKA